MSSETINEKPKRKDKWFLWLILLLFLFGLGIRGYRYLSTPKEEVTIQGVRTIRPQPRPPEMVTPSQPIESPAGSFDLVSKIAPYLTEGGFSFFLGFCLGYVLRLFGKGVMIIVGLGYAALIILSHYGFLTVDWGSIHIFLQQLLMNVQLHLPRWQSILTAGIPSIAFGSIGIWRGLRKPVK